MQKRNAILALLFIAVALLAIIADSLYKLANLAQQAKDKAEAQALSYDSEVMIEEAERTAIGFKLPESN